MTRRKNIYIYMETRVIVKFVGTKADVKLAFRMDSYVGGKQNNVSTLRERRGSALIQKSGKIDVGRGRGEGKDMEAGWKSRTVFGVENKGGLLVRAVI